MNSKLIIQNPDNPRIIKEDKFKQLVLSLKEFPEMATVRPVVIDENNVILGGNMRYKAMLEAGWDDIPVTQVKGWTEEQKREFIIKDNVSGGEWDWDILANSWDVQKLDDWGVDLPRDLQIDPEVEEDEAPEVSQEPPISQLGEVYQLGRHCVMCGDSTKIEDVEKLMDGKKADMVFTDPPYGISWKAEDMGLKGKHKFGKIIGDDEEIDLSLLFLMDAPMVVWGANNFIKQLPHKGTWLCWDKRTKVEADNVIGSAFELAWTNRNSGYYRIYRIMHGGVVNSDDKNQRRLHPTQKPIKLCVEILNDQKAGNLILDLFLGSGSTLIACEQTNRTCYGMELDPKYVDVIRKRYAKFIGKEEDWQEITPPVKQ